MAQHPPLLGLAGWSGAGKTTLLTALIPRLTASGLVIATIKHAHHRVPLDTPGKDSFRHREAGAAETLLATEAGWALFHSNIAAPPALADLAARLGPADLILVEGFRADPIPKLEIFRPELGKPALYPTDPHIEALATSAPAHPVARAFQGPVFAAADHAAIAAWIIARLPGAASNRPPGPPSGPPPGPPSPAA